MAGHLAPPQIIPAPSQASSADPSTQISGPESSARPNLAQYLSSYTRKPNGTVIGLETPIEVPPTMPESAPSMSRPTTDPPQPVHNPGDQFLPPTPTKKPYAAFL